MMRPQDDRLSVYVCTQAVDFRKGMASLAVLVEAQLGLSPFAMGREKLFCNGRQNYFVMVV